MSGTVDEKTSTSGIPHQLARKHPNCGRSHPKAADNAMRAAVGFVEVAEFPIMLHNRTAETGLLYLRQYES